MLKLIDKYFNFFDIQYYVDKKNKKKKQRMYTTT